MVIFAHALPPSLWSRDSAVMHGLLYQVRTDKDWCQVLFFVNQCLHSPFLAL
jgi:hypothetical protein